MHRLVVLGFLLIASGTAHAQFGNPYPMRNAAVDTALSNYASKEIIDLATGRRGAGRSAKPAVNHAPLAASDFKPGKGRPTVDAMLATAKLRFIDAKNLRPVVDQTFTLVEAKLRKHNVATAIGFVIATSLVIARNTELGDDALTELIAGVNDRLAASASFKGTNATDRQAMYDALIVIGAILITMNTIGANDEGIKADAMEMANAILIQTGASK